MIGQYGFLNARTRGIIEKSINLETMNRLLQVKHISEIKPILSGTEIGDNLEGLDLRKDLYQFDRRLWLAFATIIDSLAATSPMGTDKYLNIYGLKIYAENTKIVLRGISRGVEPDNIMRAIIPFRKESLGYYRSLAEMKRVDTVVDSVRDRRLRKALITHLDEYHQTENILTFESALDQVTYETLQKSNKFYGVELALRNILLVVRCVSWNLNPVRYILPSKLYQNEIINASTTKTVDNALAAFSNNPILSQIIEGISTTDVMGRLYSLELSIKRYLLSKWKFKFATNQQGSNLVFGFLELKLAGFRDINTIITGKVAGLPQEDIVSDLIVYPSLRSQ